MGVLGVSEDVHQSASERLREVGTNSYPRRCWMALTRQDKAQEGQVREMEGRMMEQEEKDRTTQLLQRDQKKF